MFVVRLEPENPLVGHAGLFGTAFLEKTVCGPDQLNYGLGNLPRTRMEVTQDASGRPVVRPIFGDTETRRNGRVEPPLTKELLNLT
jgi:hypothetical protein